MGVREIYCQFICLGHFLIDSEQVSIELFFLLGEKIKIKTIGEVKNTENYLLDRVWRD
jgi:hypothetical protein